MMADDAIVDVQDMLSLVKSNEKERTYLIKIMESPNDTSDPLDEDTVDVAYSAADRLMTGILTGNEKYIRYYKGEITVIHDNNTSGSVTSLRPVNAMYKDVKTFNEEVKKFLKAQDKPL